MQNIAEDVPGSSSSPSGLRRNGVDFLLDPFLQIIKRSRTMFENIFLKVSPKEKVAWAFRPSAKRVRNAL